MLVAYDTTNTVDIEAQLLRDGLPLTRPTRWGHGLKSFEPGILAAWKLFPGSASLGEPVTVAIAHAGFVAPQWIGVRATFSIDGVPYPVDRPGQVFLDTDERWKYGHWSCVINFPHLSTTPTFEGVHSLLLRADGG